MLDETALTRKAGQMIQVMIVDDSHLVRQMLRELIEHDDEVQVVVEAQNGAEAVDRCLTHKPDVILMDIQMPVMDGIEAVKKIMQVRPTPIIVLSATVYTGEVRSAFRALRAGALDALPKPQGLMVPENFTKVAQDLLSRIKLYALVGKKKGWAQEPQTKVQPGFISPSVSSKVVVIGASTGGPGAVMSLLSSLPMNFPSPIILVQHMSEGFLGGFSQWLDREVSLNIVYVEEAVRLEPGNVYIPNNGYHIEVSRGAAVLREGPLVNAVRPAVDVLFKSVAREYGEQVVGVLLTGMGRDGGEGALAIKEAGGTVIVQDEETCVVFGMPKVAIELGAADYVEPLSNIPARLAQAVANGQAAAPPPPSDDSVNTILVVDDSPTMLAMVSDILVSHGFIAQQAENGRMAIEEVARTRPDLVLLDVMMPEMDGYQACKELRKDSEYIPILMVTAKGEPHDLAKGLAAGADDYISKPFEEVELIARVNSLLRIRTLRKRLYAKNEELESKNRELKSLAGALDRANKELTLLSVTDGLTHAYNHRHFQERMRIEYSRAERYHTLLSCVLLDIDHFKKVNDTHGHPVGDTVLMRLVELLNESVRDEDLVARYGGEEFVLLLPETGGGRALTLAQRIRERVEQEVMVLEDGTELKFTISLGVSYYEPGSEKVRSSDQLIGFADKALYKAKENGRNRAEMA